MYFKSLLGSCMLAASYFASVQAIPNIPTTLGTHDPSRLIRFANGGYIFYGTSNYLTGWYTRDNGASWSPTPRALPNGIPAAVHNYCPVNDGINIWAPDVIWNPYTNQYMMYYSCAHGDDMAHNAIGLVTSPTIDPATASWTDRGLVIAKTDTNNQYNAIDPGPFFDTSGNMWMVFGSGFGSTSATAINVIAMNRNNGYRSDSALHVVTTGSREGAYVHYRAPYYYLFFNTGTCCSGASSTYTIHVMRSSSPSGGYGSRRVFDSGRPWAHGPGHVGIITDDGVDYYTYHYYPDTGGSVEGIGRITWSSDGWPSRAS